MKDYIRIHLANTKPVLTRMSMKAMEEKLPVHQFARIHKSYIVSLPKISAIKRGLVVVAQHEIPLSDNYKANLEALLGLQPE
jgi:DNA-binding LytR/AlgR family response regulator